MDSAFCPGSRLLRQPTPELYPCPNCGMEVEIWSDELKRVCPSCKKTVLRPGGMSCLEWCKFGKDCVGEATFASYQRDRAVGMKKRLMEALERHFGEDCRRIEHAREVLAETEELMKSEEAQWHIVVPAALLHDVGIKPAEEKYGSSEPRYQEQEGPPVARGILLKLGFQMRDIDEVCDIIGHHHCPRARETANFRVLYDADVLVNLRASAAARSRIELQELIEGRFLTRAGRLRAAELAGLGLPPA
jgi:DNA-directed RNA polymerase subunit RPC12/RpoP